MGRMNPGPLVCRIDVILRNGGSRPRNLTTLSRFIAA